MRLSASGEAFLRDREGVKLTAYQDIVGVWTIGVGQTTLNGRPVQSGDVLTEAQLEGSLRPEITKYEDAINSAVTVPLTQNQFDALFSWAWNVGISAMQHSTLVKMLNAGDIQGAADQFAAWDMVTVAGKKVPSPALRSRRALERSLFLTPDEADLVVETKPAPIVESQPVFQAPDEPPPLPDAPDSGPRSQPVSFIAAALPLLGQFLPSIIRLFGGNTEVSERNAKAAEAVGAVVTEAVGASNLQAAVEKVAADPAAREAAEAAIQAKWHDLTQLMGGIKAAADIDRQDMDAAAARLQTLQDDKLTPFYAVLLGQFILTLLVVTGLGALIWYTIAMGKDAPDLPGWASTLLGSLFVAIALEWRAILQFVVGTNKDSSAKTALIAQMTPNQK